MSSFTVFLIIILAVVVDFLWIDVDRKRWGWMKNWSKFHKVLFFSAFTAVSVIIYVGLSLEYI